MDVQHIMLFININLPLYRPTNWWHNIKSNRKILIIKLLNIKYFRIDCLELKVICEWKNKIIIKINDWSNPLTYTIRNVISPAFKYSPFQMFHLPANFKWIFFGFKTFLLSSRVSSIVKTMSNKANVANSNSLFPSWTNMRPPRPHPKKPLSYCLIIYIYIYTSLLAKWLARCHLWVMMLILSSWR